MYTTRAAGSDKKLYKNIDKSLESQHEALLRLGASLSPPQREEMAASYNLSRSSPFGNLAELSSRRTFAYLIATLNASHPDYDFSHVLRPADFRRERNLQKVMSKLDSTLGNVRPPSTLADGTAGTFDDAAAGTPTSPLWGPQMWAHIDNNMALKDCTVFSYQPVEDPFDEEEGAIWALHYFFFNKARKRVAYLYARGIPVISHSPRLRPHGLANPKRRAVSIDAGANKRARYWLGDAYADRIVSSDDDMDDGLRWNRRPDGEFDEASNYDDDDDYGNGADDDDDDDDDQARKSPVRGMSEDIAARMSVDLE